MAVKNRKPKKHVIGKYPLGGAIGGLTPELMDLLRTYVQDNTPGNNQGVTTDTTPITDSLPIDNLGQSLTPDLMGGIDTPSIEKKPSINIGDALSKGIEANSGLMSLMGGIQTGLANKPGYAPDVSQGISGGALSGLSTGFSMGGPMGGLIGLLGGGALGFMNSGQKREDYETALERSRKQRVKDRTVDPFMGVLYAEEGGITPGEILSEDLSPVQTEIEEMVLLPSGILTHTKAEEEHDDMDDDDITDILPAGSIIFSNSKDKMLEITEELKDTVLGYGTAFYSEEGELSEVEGVEFEDVLDEGKKSMTFSEVALNIKNKFSTVDNKNDIFANISNVENMAARMPWLTKLVELQDKAMGTTSLGVNRQAPAFKYGGVVKKYVDGGLIDIIMNTLKKQNIWPYKEPDPSGGGVPGGTGGGGGNGMDLLPPDQAFQDLLAKHQDFLDTTRANLEAENATRTEQDAKLFKDLRTNNAVANGLIGPFGFLMQNPQVKPAYVDTNLSGAMFRPSNVQATQGIANTGLGQANALAQELIRQGVNPSDAISMTASARDRATEQSNEINLKQLQKNEELDRAKYKFLSEARTANDAADVKAYNDTTDNQNKIIAGIAGEGKTFLKDASSIAMEENTWRTQRAKDYFEGITNLGKSEVNLADQEFSYTKAMENAAKQEKALQDYLDYLKQQSSSTDNGTNDSNGKPIELIQATEMTGTPEAKTEFPINTPQTGDVSVKPTIPSLDEVEKMAGDKEKIKKLQNDLFLLGYDLPKSRKKDGTFDGVLGSETRALINKVYDLSSNNYIQTPEVTGTPSPLINNPVAIGEISVPTPEEAKDMSPKQVESLQILLNDDRKNRGLKPLKPDSKYGPKTEEALIEYMKHKRDSYKMDAILLPILQNLKVQTNN